MHKAECPYCGENNEINHDDGFGLEDDQQWEQECKYCGKIFIFQSSTQWYFHAEKAPCLNGEDHNWVKIVGAPREYLIGRQRCSYCGKEPKID